MEKPLKFAGWSGIIYLVLIIFSLIVGNFLTQNSANAIIFGMVFNLTSIVFLAFFVFGFINLGRRFDNKLLVVLAWISFVIIIIFGLLMFTISIFSLFGAGNGALFSPELIQDGILFSPGATDNPALNGLFGFILGFIILLILLIVAAIVLQIFFGVALLRLDKNGVPLAKTAGILNIVAASTYIIIIGFFVAFAAFIVEIIMFFKASNRYEKGMVR